MYVDEKGVHGGGSDHNWIELVLSDKFKRPIIRRKAKQVKKTWNITDNQDWTVYKEEVIKNLPNGNVDKLSVNELAKAVTTALHNAGVSAIGYKQHKRTKSMRSRPKISCRCFKA